MMAVSRRLHTPMTIRPDDEINESPKRVAFLSVEGNCTERDYFKYIEKYKEQLGINSLVHVETLSKYSADTCSDPEEVYNLLNEYLSIRREGILPEDIFSILCNERDKYSIESIRKFLNNELPEKDSNRMKSAIQLAGVDIDYQKFLCDYRGEDGTDVFAVIIDRDQGSHSEQSLRELIEKCSQNGCHCFISNPCFEFWLLLHLSDIKTEYSKQYSELLENKKISNKHTFVSYEVSKKASHTKRISEAKFKQFYLNNIDNAISRAQDFNQDDESLLSNLGTNLPGLFSILREKV